MGRVVAPAAEAIGPWLTNSAIPPELIQVTVRGGWVTSAAEKVIEYLYGVKGVANSIVVKAPVTASNVRQKI